MRKPLGIIFDLGDTVLDYYYNNPFEGSKKVLEYAKNKEKINAEEIQSFCEILTKETFDKRDVLSIEICMSNFHRLLYEYFGITFEKDFKEIEMIFNENAYKSTPSEGIQRLLETLKKYNIKTGILSNSSFSRETLNSELKRHSIDTFFDFIISSADYCLRKPSKYIYNLAIRKIGFEPQDIWFVGDNFDWDVIGPYNVGMFPVWYNKKNQVGKEKIDYLEVKNMSEIIHEIEGFYK